MQNKMAIAEERCHYSLSNIYGSNYNCTSPVRKVTDYIFKNYPSCKLTFKCLICKSEELDQTNIYVPFNLNDLNSKGLCNLKECIINPKKYCNNCDCFMSIEKNEYSDLILFDVEPILNIYKKTVLSNIPK